jgi:lipopolysaccharide transport system permease protein
VSVEATARPGFGHWAGITWMLGVRTFRIRYLRSRLGIGWALAQPLVQAAVLSFVFLKVFKVGKVEHYPLYVLSGIMTWQAFSGSVNGATTSAVDNAGLLRKVRMPAVVFPVAHVTSVLIVFTLQAVVLVALAVAVGTAGPGLLLLPLVMLLLSLLATGIGLLTCALYVAYRDVKFLVESGLLLAFYASPVLYHPDAVPDSVAWVLELNPMYGVMLLARTALLGEDLPGRPLVSTLAGLVLLLVAGGLLFRRRSRGFADLV